MVSLYSAKVRDVAKLIEAEEPPKIKRKYVKKIKPIEPVIEVPEESVEEKAEDGPPPEEEVKSENEEKQEKLIVEKVEKVLKKAKTKRDPEQPPKWFTKFHESIGREQSAQKKDKKPVKHIKKESLEVAEEAWQKPAVREKVRNEVDSHMSSMYNMIFSNRSFK